MATIWNQNGTNEADTIYVTEPGINVIGGYGDDTFIVKGSAANNRIGGDSSEYGNDILKILAGEEITFVNKKGSNTIEISDGMNHNIQTGGKDDTLIIKSNADSVLANLGAGKNIINIYAGTQHNINAGNGNDTLTVGYMESSGVNLGNGENRITLNGGFGNTIRSGVDKDTITVNKGYNNKIYAGDGDDVLYVNKDTGSNEFWSGRGSDRFTVSSTNKQTIHIDESDAGDKNTIILKAGEGHVITVNNQSSNAITGLYIENANNVTASFYNEKNSAVISSGTGNSISLGDNNDMGSIRGGTDNIIRGGSGNDTLSIEGSAGAGNALYGDYGDDNLYVNAGVSGIQTLDGGGNGTRDAFNVNSETAIVHISANGEKASFVLNKGTAMDKDGIGHTVTSTASNNYLYIGKDANSVANNVHADINNRLNNCFIYGSNNQVIGTSNPDSVYIRFGEGNFVSTQGGNDYIYIDGGNNHTIYGGGGDRDSFYVRMSLDRSTRLTFNQLNNNGDRRDILYLPNESAQNFSFEYDSLNNALLISKNNGALITVENWANNRIALIKFKDSEVKGDNLPLAESKLATALMVFNTEERLGGQQETVSALTEKANETIFITGSANA